MAGNPPPKVVAPISEKTYRKFFARNILAIYDQVEQAFIKSLLTQDELACKLGKDKSTVSRVLNGSGKNVTIKTLSDFALAMDYDLKVVMLEKGLQLEKKPRPLSNQFYCLENTNPTSNSSGSTAIMPNFNVAPKELQHAH